MYARIHVWHCTLENIESKCSPKTKENEEGDQQRLRRMDFDEFLKSNICSDSLLRMNFHKPENGGERIKNEGEQGRNKE